MIYTAKLPFPPSTLSRRNWSKQEIQDLVALYDGAGTDGVLSLTKFSAKIGRNKSNVCRKAKSLGLSINKSRKIVETRKVRIKKFASADERKSSVSIRMKKYIKDYGHPRGMLGKKHTAEAKRIIAESSRERWAAMAPDEQSEFTIKALKSKVEKYGYIAPRNTKTSWKSGWREIGGYKKYYRSRWEANYARYLEWLKANGEISEWKHEPETFWFEAIKRGVRSYLPDFRVWENDGNSNLHEVKGWMDARSKTTLKRMAKYHPNETIILIDGKQYTSIERKVSSLISGWEPK